MQHQQGAWSREGDPPRPGQLPPSSPSPCLSPSSAASRQPLGGCQNVPGGAWDGADATSLCPAPWSVEGHGQGLPAWLKGALALFFKISSKKGVGSVCSWAGGAIWRQNHPEERHRSPSLARQSPLCCRAALEEGRRPQRQCGRPTAGRGPRRAARGSKPSRGSESMGRRRHSQHHGRHQHRNSTWHFLAKMASDCRCPTYSNTKYYE